MQRLVIVRLVTITQMGHTVVPSFLFCSAHPSSVSGLVTPVTFRWCICTVPQETTFDGTVFLPIQGLHPVDTVNLVSAGSTAPPPPTMRHCIRLNIWLRVLQPQPLCRHCQRLVCCLSTWVWSELVVGLVLSQTHRAIFPTELQLNIHSRHTGLVRPKRAVIQIQRFSVSVH